MRYIFPPHPASGSRIKPEDLPAHEKSGKWLAQFKFNGIHVVCWTDGAAAEIRDRRNIVLSTYHLTPSMESLLIDLGQKKEIVLVGELLHTKAKTKSGKQAVTDTIVFFDILYHGQHLLDINQTQRLQLLKEVVGNPTELETRGRGFVVNKLDESNLWLAETFTEEFDYRFDQFYDDPEIEGLILRLADSRLDTTGDKQYDCRWLVRCRKQKDKLYQF